MVLLQTLRRCHDDNTFHYLLCAYQNAETRCVLCVCSNWAPSHAVLGDPTATNEDVAALLRRCVSCMSFYCLQFDALHF